MYDGPSQHALFSYKFTGKERDSESGLDNFGARYMGSSLGRFMSPDPLLNSGRPSNPQTWNRYAYTRNNPLNITDPTGLYDLINTCNLDANFSKCTKKFEQDARKLKDGLANLQSQADNAEDPSQKASLETSLGALGTEGDHNGVFVSFGNVENNAAGNTKAFYDDGKINFGVTFDLRRISSQDQLTIAAAHEGTHVDDIKNPRYSNAASTLSDFSLEYRAYQTSAWAARALRLPNLSFDDKGGKNMIWNRSWSEADRQTLMDRGITNHVVSIPGHPETTPHNPWEIRP